MYRIGFIMEQALGHVAHAQNIMANVPGDPEVIPYWGLVPWETRGLASRLPLYRSNWSLRAGLRARRLVARLERQALTPAPSQYRGGERDDASIRFAEGRGGEDGRRAKPGGLDALFFHTQVAAMLATGWLRRIPGVVSLDATPIQFDRLGGPYGHAQGPAALEHYKWRVNRDCFRAARHLVTWSAWARQGLIDDYETPPEKVTVIPPGVNAREWRRPEPRQHRSAQAAPVKILFVGGNLERKGGLVLLEAFRRLAREAGPHPTQAVELHLVTRDILPQEPGVFVYHDISPNSEPLKRLYHDCDIFCLPTYADCLPIALIEAAAAGLPAIATGIAAIPEIVRQRETGLLVPPGNPATLAAALGCLIAVEDLRLRLGAQAVQLVTAEFDAQCNTARLIELLKQVARAPFPTGRETGAAAKTNEERA